MTQAHHAQDDAGPEAHAGPRFPDLFQMAMQGSHYADFVSVNYDGDDQRNEHPSAADARAPESSTSRPGSATADVGAFSGASANRRRWRKGH